MKNLVMISIDAASSSDLAHILRLPNFAALKEKSTLVKDVSAVFVSNTYPAHTSIITGVHPNKHGLVENLMLDPGKRHQDWRTDSRLIRSPTLYDRAREAGADVCAILYPVTANADIRYNFPEIPGHMNIFRRLSLMIKGGSPGFILGSALRFGGHLKSISAAGLDDFTTHTAADILRRRKVRLLLLHLIDTDSQKHSFGPNSKEAVDSFKRHDRRLGWLINALKDAGIYDETGIIIFSDHSCLGVHTSADPNDFLEREGLLKRKHGRAASYKAFFHNAGGTAFLKIYDKESAEDILAAARQILAEDYVGRELSPLEMSISGMDGEYALGIEAAKGFSFGRYQPGQHGYSLEQKDYAAFYMAKGEKIPPGEEASGGCIVDICPLAADMLGIDKWEMDGRNRVFKPG
ncbi:MAG: alkaline phosphatase family protein [Christensenellales bacterium]|jgi:predicted AlkP superfamily pyrophosphatase or phosphodiesterase